MGKGHRHLRLEETSLEFWCDSGVRGSDVYETKRRGVLDIVTDTEVLARRGGRRVSDEPSDNVSY